MSIKFRVWGGGGGVLKGGGKCRFYLYGRADFSEKILFFWYSLPFSKEKNKEGQGRGETKG